MKPRKQRVKENYSLPLSILSRFEVYCSPSKFKILIISITFYSAIMLFLLLQGKLEWLGLHPLISRDNKKTRSYYYSILNATKYSIIPYTPPKILKNLIKDIEKPWNDVVNCCKGVPNKRKKFPTFNKCAFVTSSGHLLGSGAGEEIDRADCVIRTNDSPTLGYEKDVGKKTTLRYMAPTGTKKVSTNSESLLNSTYKPKILIIQAFSQSVKMIAEEWANSYPEIDIFILHSKGHNSLKRKVHQFGQEINASRDNFTMPSGGIKAIMISMQMCKNVTVYGIASPHHCRDVYLNKTTDVNYHYYESPAENNSSKYGQKECFNYNRWETHSRGHHDPTLEKYIYAIWMKEGANLAFRFPHWTHPHLMDDSMLKNIWSNEAQNYTASLNYSLYIN